MNSTPETFTPAEKLFIASQRLIAETALALSHSGSEFATGVEKFRSMEKILNEKLASFRRNSLVDSTRTMSLGSVYQGTHPVWTYLHTYYMILEELKAFTAF